MIDPNTIIDGRYLVVSRIGSGGMADVYLAEDQLLGRKVAVKVLHHHFAEDGEFVERFRREASSAAALSHPNVVSVFDRGEWNETYYIAMEYLPGRSLKALVREQGALDPALAIDIVVQVLRATRFAHHRGVIHRDLKPHNVILDEEGRAKVTDFGIARAGASDMTLTGSIMGTAQYLSPEQAQGHAVSEASDLYAIGVVLYELLTGSVPFNGETAVAIALQQVSTDPIPPSTVATWLPPALDGVVLRALAKDPAQRFANADEFIAALQEIRAGLPTPIGEHVLAGAPAWPVVTATSAAETTFVAGGPLHADPLLAAPLLGPADHQQTDDDPAGGAKGPLASIRKHWLWYATALTAVIVAAALVLVLGESKGTVPNVTGETEAVALATLRHSGFVPVSVPAPSATLEKGLVISEDPPHGSSLASGSNVRIKVSTGPPHAAVPGVAGLSRAHATEKLTSSGFKPVVKMQSSETVARGVAVGTSPPKGAQAQLGGNVTLLISSGPAQVQVPSVIGSSTEAASTALTDAGLKVGTITSKVAKGKAIGTVLSQTPGSGTSVSAGSAVNLVTASAPKQVVVPSVVGANDEQAIAMLESAGFSVLQTAAVVTDPLLVGLVVKQHPSAGHKVHEGATVTISLGAPIQTSTTTSSSSTTSTSTTSTSTTTAPPEAP